MDGQPVEQFGVRGETPHAAKVVGSVDDPLAEVMVPHAVHDRPPRERVLRIGDPASQRRAAGRLQLRMWQLESRVETGHAVECAGERFADWLRDFAATLQAAGQSAPTILLAPAQQVIGATVYEVMFVADPDGLPLELIHSGKLV